MDTIGHRRLDDMTLSELLRRKMVDYGYRDEEALAKALGIEKDRLMMMMQGGHVYPGPDERQAINRVLDVDTGVLRAMMELPGLRDYEMQTLIAYGRHGMSIRLTAKALFVHPSTVSYRLNHIAERTGLNPRDKSDLAVLIRAGTKREKR